MIKINIYDNNTNISFDAPITIKEIMESIGYEFPDFVIAGKVNDKLVDLSYLIKQDSLVKILTINDEEGFNIFKHSAAHLLAHAVCELFPGAQPTVGPAIAGGFYHDFYYPKGFTNDDLPKIEKKMHELSLKELNIVREIWHKNDAIDYFKSKGDTYKVLMINDILSDEVSIYKHGNFINVCRGPHVPNTKYIKFFKLTKLSGSYWQGNSKNEMLCRIYGTVWNTEKELLDHLEAEEKAKQRDHRLIGKKMDLFHLQEEAPGIVFWHPKGWIIYGLIKKYLQNKLSIFGYKEVSTPIIVDKSLWNKSGHWDNYKDVMFITESENHTYAVKPMNCPGHVMLFKQGLKSYRDLPIRYSEFGYCHRNEISGSLHGIMRVRGFTMDDGHIFCTTDQIESESFAYIDQLITVCNDFGFDKNKIKFKLSTRPIHRIGSDVTWDKAEKALSNVLETKKINWQLSPGDGAFYGPKIEVSLRDSLNRVWQCGTLQVDFFMAERLGAYYIDEHGEKLSPVILHRAMLGSLERFIGILLEETSGNLPLWLSPIQSVIIGITDNQNSYIQKIYKQLLNNDCRVIHDLRNEKIGFKIREHTVAKIPFILIVGKLEEENNTIMVRSNEGKILGQMSIEQVIFLIKNNK